jgi:hypothetical protein
MLSYYSAIVLIVFVSIPWTSSVPVAQFYSTEGGLTVNSDDGFSLPVRGHNNKKIPFFGNSYDFIVVSYVSTPCVLFKHLPMSRYIQYTLYRSNLPST